MTSACREASSVSVRLPGFWLRLSSVGGSLMTVVTPSFVSAVSEVWLQSVWQILISTSPPMPWIHHDPGLRVVQCE